MSVATSLPVPVLTPHGPDTDDTATFSLGDLLALQAETRPDQPFFLGGVRGGEALTFGDAHRRVAALTTTLEDLQLDRMHPLRCCFRTGRAPRWLLLASSTPVYGRCCCRRMRRSQQLSSMMVKAAPEAIIAGGLAGRRSSPAWRCGRRRQPTASVCVAAFGNHLPNGVLALDERGRPRRPHCCLPGRRPRAS